MITHIRISNFKAFSSADIALTPLTLLMGENGVGKSTVSQSILLSKQNVTLDPTLKNAFLNGPFVHIGNGSDALRQNADEERIGVSLGFADGVFSWEADYNSGSDVLSLHAIDQSGVAALQALTIRHLSADRVGPQLTSPYSESSASKTEVDERGLNALGLLHYCGDRALDASDSRVPAGVASRSVTSLFNSYLGQVATGASVVVQDLSEIDSVSTTFTFTGQSELPMERIRPTNVGFGLSYCASIIISCLLAKPGDLIIVENPEAHLHTKGQRALASLLVRTAQAGVQVLCETHSREILYDIRKMVLQKKINSNLASVAYVFANKATEGRIVGSWMPLSTPIADLGEFGADFLDNFGAPTDFQQGVF